MDPVTRRVQVKTRGGSVVSTYAREHYLRKEMPCRAKLCFEHCDNDSGDNNESGSLLPGDVTHYLLPLEDVVRGFFDVIEFPELRGIIFLQSVVAPVQNASLRHYRRVCDLIRDRRKGSPFFANEFFEATNVERNDGETMKEWRTRAALRAAAWYYEHLGGQKPVVVVTEDDDIVERHAADRHEVFVLKLGQYLEDFWPSLSSEARDVYAGLLESKRAVGSKTSKRSEEDYADYYKSGVVEAGLRQGRLFKGKLCVDKYHAGKEAFVIAR